MNTYYAVAALIALGALTPGPNNLVVLGAGARGGLWAALPPIAGIVAGSLAMLAVVAAGFALPLSSPPTRSLVALAGAVYLAALGVRLLRAPAATDANAATLPRNAAGLFAFQFANPKAWLLAASVVALAPSRDAVLFALYAAIPALSLALWAGAGAMLAGWFQAHRRGVDVANGVLLLAFAALLTIENIMEISL